MMRQPASAAQVALTVKCSEGASYIAQTGIRHTEALGSEGMHEECVTCSQEFVLRMGQLPASVFQVCTRQT